METTASDGKNYMTNFYKLDAIISVGYRVNSYEATQFSKWATKVLSQYLIRGFTLDNERLKQGNNLFGKDYFEEGFIRKLRTYMQLQLTMIIKPIFQKSFCNGSK